MPRLGAATLGVLIIWRYGQPNWGLSALWRKYGHVFRTVLVGQASCLSLLLELAVQWTGETPVPPWPNRNVRPNIRKTVLSRPNPKFRIAFGGCFVVIPADAGIQGFWTSAFAGVTCLNLLPHL